MSRYTLIVKEGKYEADTLYGLLWEVFKHRLQHWRAGEGWID